MNISIMKIIVLLKKIRPDVIVRVIKINVSVRRTFLMTNDFIVGTRSSGKTRMMLENAKVSDSIMDAAIRIVENNISP